VDETLIEITTADTVVTARLPLTFDLSTTATPAIGMASFTSAEVAVTIGDSSVATRPRSPIERRSDLLATAVQQRRQHRQKEGSLP
jgi:hypothetical protein